MPENKTYLVKESLFESILSDIISIGILIGGAFVNYRYCGQSFVVDGFIVMMFIIYALKSGGKVEAFNGESDLLVHLCEKHGLDVGGLINEN